MQLGETLWNEEKQRLGINKKISWNVYKNLDVALTARNAAIYYNYISTNDWILATSCGVIFFVWSAAADVMNGTVLITFCVYYVVIKHMHKHAVGVMPFILSHC